MSRLSCGALLVTMQLALAAAAYAQPAKQTVDGICTSCHRANTLTGSAGYDADGWKALTETMVDLSGSEEMQRGVMQYLAATYPPNPRRAAKLVPGPIQVSFKEWALPTLAQRPVDAAQAADGTIWWVGEFLEIMGSINPATGEMKEYPLPRDARPNALEIDSKGNVWFTGTKNGTLGYLDPKTGKPTVFKLPDANARDPHVLTFDKAGIAWFTVPGANMIGRLDPANGSFRLVAAKQAYSKPFGVKIDAGGNPWVACSGQPCLYKVDPASMAQTEIKLPLQGTTVRRLDFASDGAVWYVNTGRGRIGRVDPKSGESKEWPTPSGPRSQPSAIAVLDGAVWFSEAGVRPDALVRFDPKTEAFQSWAIPSGSIQVGATHNIRVTPDGGLLLQQSSTNRVVKVTIGR